MYKIDRKGGLGGSKNRSLGQTPAVDPEIVWNKPKPKYVVM